MPGVAAKDLHPVRASNMAPHSGHTDSLILLSSLPWETHPIPLFVCVTDHQREGPEWGCPSKDTCCLLWGHICGSTLQSAGSCTAPRLYRPNKGQWRLRVFGLSSKAPCSIWNNARAMKKMAKDNMQNSDLLSAVWLDLGTFNKRERVLALWFMTLPACFHHPQSFSALT